jgi:putative SOS response-associated peptidase YedK
MCGRLSQYRGIHDFVAALSIPDAMINHVGDEPLARYNAAPTTQLALLHLENDGLHADPQRWGWPALGEGSRHRSMRGSRKSPMARFSGDLAAPGNLPDRQLVRMGGRRRRHPATLADPTTRPGTDLLRGNRTVLVGALRLDDGFVIITADSAGGLLDIHDRRPVVLSAELAREWLDPATPKERAEQLVLLQGEGSDAFQWHRGEQSGWQVAEPVSHLDGDEITSNRHSLASFGLVPRVSRSTAVSRWR